MVSCFDGGLAAERARWSMRHRSNARRLPGMPQWPARYVSPELLSARALPPAGMGAAVDVQRLAGYKAGRL